MSITRERFLIGARRSAVTASSRPRRPPVHPRKGNIGDRPIEELAQVLPGRISRDVHDEQIRAIREVLLDSTMMALEGSPPFVGVERDLGVVSLDMQCATLEPGLRVTGRE